MSHSQRVFKKGEIIYKEGDKIASIFLIQSGKVALQIPRGKNNIEVQIFGNGLILGEQGLAGIAKHNLNAMALAETKMIEIPMEDLTTLLEGVPQLERIMMRGMAEKIKLMTNEMKSIKQERNALPVPPENIPKLFGTMFALALLKGRKDEATGIITVTWRSYKQYAQKVFLESLSRLDQALQLLVKMDLADYKMWKPEDDPTAPEEIGEVRLLDPIRLELFFEFFQHYHYKGASGAEILRVSDTLLNVVGGLLKLTENEQPDKNGVVRMDFNAALEVFDSQFGVKLSPENMNYLEQKGLFVKRVAAEGGKSVLSFDRREFYQTHLNWRFIRELDLWNQRGVVYTKDEEEKEKKANAVKGQILCPGCSQPYQAGFKFCANCGAKLAA